MWEQHRSLSLQVPQGLPPALLTQRGQTRLLLLLALRVSSHLRTEGLRGSWRLRCAQRHLMLRACSWALCKQWATISTGGTSTAPRYSTKDTGVQQMRLAVDETTSW